MTCSIEPFKKKRVVLFLICAVQQKIDADMVVFRKSDENVRRDIPGAVLIVGVGALGDVQHIAQLRLGQIRIDSEIFDSGIDHETVPPKTDFHKTEHLIPASLTSKNSILQPVLFY